MKPKRKVNKRKFRRALIMINAILVSLLACISFLIIRAISVYRKDSSIYIAAASSSVSTPAERAKESVITETPSDLSENWEYPEETAPIIVDFDEEGTKSSNIVAWLYCEGTPINYPVVACENNTYFLTHDYTGVKNNSGAIFSDERNGSNLSGDNIILYGHHMKDRSMFGSLLQYQKQTYLDEHKTLYLITPEKDYRITVFAAWFCDGSLDNYPILFLSEDSKKHFFEKATQESIANANPEYDADERMISLVTCSYSKYLVDPHFQVNGWLIEIGNSS